MQHILDVNLPEQNPQGAPGGDFQHIDSNPNMFGGHAARAEQALGQGLERAGNTGIEFAIEQNQVQNRLHAADVKSWYADQTTDLHTKFMSLSGRAALDALPQYKQNLADLRVQALEKVPSQTSKALLNDSLTTMQDQYYRYWSGHAGGQLKSYSEKVAQDSIASSSALAVNSLLAGDELGFERRLREQDAEVHNLYDGQGYAPDAMSSEVTKRRGATLKVAIETVAAGGDVAKAQALFDKYRDRMDPGSVLQVTANLKSGIAQIGGRAIADDASGHVLPKAESIAGVPAGFVAQVKRTEGYAPAAKWDAKQFSNGYGTRAASDGETITREEAESRFAAAFAKAAKIVDSVNPNLDPGTRAALTALTYNAGADWVSAGLGDKIRAGDLAGAQTLFLEYNKSEGRYNEGLAARRYREAQWFGAAEAPAGNGPLVDKQTAYERVLARTDSNPLLQTAAIARLNQVYGIYHTESANQNASFDLRLQDTQAEALATGQAKSPLTEPDFVARYGVADGRRQYGEYQKNLALGADVAALATMSPAEQAALLSSRAPVPGSPGYAADAKRQAVIQKAITSQAKETVEPRIRETQAEALSTGTVKAPVTEAEFINLYGDKEGRRQFDAYRKNIGVGGEVAALPAMSPEEQGRLLASHTPEPGSEDFVEEQKRQQAVQKALAHVIKERDDDPAAFAIRRLPAVQAAFGDFTTAMANNAATPQARAAAAAKYATVMLAEQARVGVAADDRRVVPQAYIDRLNSALATPDKEGGTSMVAQRIQGEAQLWGQYWPQVYRQLSKEAVPAVRVIGSGVQSAAAQMLVDVMPLSLSAILKDQDTEKNAAIKKDVLDAFKPLAKSMEGNEGALGLFNDFRGQAEKLAARYVIGGMTSSEAAAKAFEQLVGFKYTFQSGYRVPKDAGVDAEVIAKGTVAALRELGKGDPADPLAVAPPADTIGGLSADYLRQAKVDSLRRDGKWVTSPDEKGLMLVHNDQAVRRPDGSALVLTWKQLQDLGTADIKAKDKQFNTYFRLGTFG